MYGLSSHNNIAPKPLSSKLVESGVVLASTGRQDLPRVDANPDHRFTASGDPVKIQLGTNHPTSPLGLGLAKLREFLKDQFAKNPDLHYGITSEGPGWGTLQAYSKA